MFQFLVYRFPAMIQINGKDVRNDDRQNAKQLFSNFDQSLQISEKLQNFDNIQQLKNFQKDRSYLKQFHKCLNDVSNEQKIVFEYRKTFDNIYEDYLIQLMQQCIFQNILHPLSFINILVLLLNFQMKSIHIRVYSKNR